MQVIFIEKMRFNFRQKMTPYDVVYSSEQLEDWKDDQRT